MLFPEEGTSELVVKLSELTAREFKGGIGSDKWLLGQQIWCTVLSHESGWDQGLEWFRNQGHVHESLTIF